MTVTKDIIYQWLELKEKLNQIQEAERLLRCKITDELLEGKIEGAKTLVVDSVKVTVTAVLSYKLDISELSLVYPNLSAEEKEAIKWVPELKMKEFRKLPADCELAKLVTTTPGMSQFKVLG